MHSNLRELAIRARDLRGHRGGLAYVTFIAAIDDPKTILALLDRAEAAERDNVCDACLGSTPISGKPCMCGGTGKMSDAARYLREQLVATQSDLRQARITIEQSRADCTSSGAATEKFRMECESKDIALNNLRKDLRWAREEIAQRNKRLSHEQMTALAKVINSGDLKASAAYWRETYDALADRYEALDDQLIAAQAELRQARELLHEVAVAGVNNRTPKYAEVQIDHGTLDAIYKQAKG